MLKGFKMTLNDINSWYMSRCTDENLLTLINELYILRNTNIIKENTHIFKLYTEIAKEHCHQTALMLVEAAILDEAASRWYMSKIG